MAGSGGFYGRWVGANAIGELVGLGATLALTAGAWPLIDRAGLALGLAIALGVALVGAGVEGVVVGSAQWAVIRRRLPALPWLSWALARKSVV